MDKQLREEFYTSPLAAKFLTSKGLNKEIADYWLDKIEEIRKEAKLELVDDQLAGKIPYYNACLKEAVEKYKSYLVGKIDESIKRTDITMIGYTKTLERRRGYVEGLQAAKDILQGK